MGGKDKAYLYFNDEGVDQSQRMKEMVRYYREVLEPAGDVPFIMYGVNDPELEGRGLDSPRSSMHRMACIGDRLRSRSAAFLPSR